jgi:hypothetical protein
VNYWAWSAHHNVSCRFHSVAVVAEPSSASGALRRLAGTQRPQQQLPWWPTHPAGDAAWSGGDEGGHPAAAAVLSGDASAPSSALLATAEEGDPVGGVRAEGQQQHVRLVIRRPVGRLVRAAILRTVAVGWSRRGELSFLYQGFYNPLWFPFDFC